MRSYEMSGVVTRGLDACLEEASAIATDDCRGVFLSVDIDVASPWSCPWWAWTWSRCRPPMTMPR
jgi:arginase family enzyme